MESRVYLGRGIPRSWIGTGKEISIKRAPTRWGGITLTLVANPDEKVVHAAVELSKAGAPAEFQLTFRVPASSQLQTVTVNGRRAELPSPRNESVLVKTESEKHFEVWANYA
jgi:hypothetical protein